MTLSTEKIREFLQRSLDTRNGFLESQASIDDTRENLKIIISTVEEYLEETKTANTDEKSACLDYLKEAYEHLNNLENNQKFLNNSQKKLDDTIRELKNLLD